MAAGVKTQEIIDRVRVRIAEPSESMITDAQLADFITECQRDLVWQLPDAALWAVTADKTTTIVAGQEAYTFETTDSAATRFVRELSVKWKVTYARRLELEDQVNLATIPDLKASDTNPFYTIHNDGITFELGGEATQSNGSTFIIRYIKLPADIDIGSSPVEPEFPWQFFGIIEDFVVSRAWEQREEPERAATAYQSYIQRVQAVWAHYQPGADTHLAMPVGVRP